jgi:hypothetical protein
MLVYAVILILVVPVAFLTSTLDSLFSPDELTDMGIRLEGQQT